MTHSASNPAPLFGLAPPADAEDAPEWLEEAIAWARDRGATDLHLFPGEDGARMWVRIDGELRDLAGYAPAVHERMIARLKVMGRCTDYHGEVIQEGRFDLNGGKGAGEARLSIVPTLRGEKAVVRLLSGGERLKRLGELGFGPGLLAELSAATARPHGLILAVGPSGSGKSTALYALLEALHSGGETPLSILTIEDPIEQSLPFAAQVGVDRARGLDFLAGLRAVLRQDPEVIMIGEIRDPETARIALQAALTGHRLMTSMHTLSASEALVRLRQMGAPPFEIASAVAGVLNLRLARRACPECRATRALTPAEREEFDETVSGALEAPGCEACLGSGHRGQIGVGEWAIATPETAGALQRGEATPAIAATLERPIAARDEAARLLAEPVLTMNEYRRVAALFGFDREPGPEARDAR